MKLAHRSPATLLALLLAASRVVTGEDVSSLPGCGQTCFNLLLNDAGMGCEPGVTSCFCTKPDFQFGIHDCVTQNCKDDTAAIASVTNFATALCATATIPPAAAATTSSSSPPPPPATTTPPSEPSSSSSPLPSSTSSDSSESVVSATSSTSSSSEPTATAATTAEESAATSPSESSTESSNGSTTTSSSGAAATTSSAAAGSAGSLSVGAKAGIGIGAAAVVAGVIAAVVFLTVRRRQRRDVRSANYVRQLQISDPLPGSGRDYASGDSGSVATRPPRPDTGSSELESQSRRYEDMVPREKPRYVV